MSSPSRSLRSFRSNTPPRLDIPDSNFHPKPILRRHVKFGDSSDAAAQSRRSSVSIGSGPRRPARNASFKEEYHEQSPLLFSARSNDGGAAARSSGYFSPRSDASWMDDHEESVSTGYLLLLTMTIIGLQIAWSVELSNGSPYLLGLGIDKSLLALVWIAGPLSGTLVQPYVGIKSDRCRSRFGKRRPFMVGGAIATVISLIALAWTRELIAGILGLFGVPEDSETTATTSIVFAVTMIYVLDFSINVIQAGVRAFIVDNAPTHQQDTANAWAARLSGVGNIVGYLFGYVDLPKYFAFVGDTQFKVLCVFACIVLLGTLTISCITIQERDPRLDGELEPQTGGVLTFFRDLFHSMQNLPDQIKRVCEVQFFAWIGWFPFLFYITTYVGGVYVDPIFREHENMSSDEIDAAWAEATRMGTFALLIFAITTFASSVLLPFLVASSFRPEEPEPITPRTPLTPGGGKLPRTPKTPHTPLTPGGAAAGGYFVFDPYADKPAAMDKTKGNVFQRVYAHLPSPELRWLTLRRTWLFSHILFCILTWATLFVRDTIGATVLVALIGIPWSMTNWAPYALIAAEISKRENIRRGLIPPPPTHDGELLARGEDPSDGSDQAGVVLGIHNVAIAAPQVIATLVSSVIFRFLQKPRGTPGDDSVAWVLRFGGLAALIAAYLTKRVHEEART
ncbi:hypothetical protein AMS68_004676 [Peltaster fructicola]|uniref:Major facilitator superfamily (MFS) profile domain-containing protein n=1 Tax=Peltaster fructicola TaxID=286661 RepID=A0A6H0XX13_9PEZI|nr:hypothetical protein AMS68_004676 [Peltaster fructicola]